MDKTTDQIESDIRQTRASLHTNFQELETKVKSATDWRHYFDKNPGGMIAGAFAAGAVLALLGGNSKGRRYVSYPSTASRPSSGNAYQRPKNEILQTWENVKGALVGVAASEVTGILGKMLPGFQSQLAKREGRQTNAHEPMSMDGESHQSGIRSS